MANGMGSSGYNIFTAIHQNNERNIDSTNNIPEKCDKTVRVGSVIQYLKLISTS